MFIKAFMPENKIIGLCEALNFKAGWVLAFFRQFSTTLNLLTNNKFRQCEFE